jgi:hypothetical protein
MQIETAIRNAEYVDAKDEVRQKEAQLLKEYNKQFQKILPKKKVLLMYRTENEFRAHLIREFRKGDGPRRD